MFERFTDRARRVVVLAQEEARLLSHNYIGTEHILLGLIHEQEGVAAKVLEALGISVETVRGKVESIIGAGEGTPTGHIPFTARSKKVLELSLREALQLGHNYIGTEHILLGLIREGEGVGAQILVNLGADLSAVRGAILQQLSGTGRGPRLTAPGFGPPRQTPAAAKAGVEARRLAGSGPVGSHHYLLALLNDEQSVAAKALEGLGVTRQSLKEKLDAIEPAGTTDETPEEAGARRISLRVEGRLLTLEIDDADLAASLEKAMVGRTVRIITGTDPEAEEAGFPALWSAVSRTVEDLTRRMGFRGVVMQRGGARLAPAKDWRPPGWHHEGHAGVYWIVSTAGGGTGHLETSPETDAGAVRGWLRDWLAANQPNLAAHANERAARHCSLWAFVNHTGDAFTMTSFGFGVDGPPGCEPVPLDVLITYALEDLTAAA
jgi:ATP-dependent Clp protease ATP-binding subunit ClpC